MAQSSSNTINKLFEIKNTLFTQLLIVNGLIEQESNASDPTQPELAKFKVTLELTTNPAEWSLGEADEELVRSQILESMFRIKEALEFDDEYDEVELLSVEKVN